MNTVSLPQALHITQNTGFHVLGIFLSIFLVLIVWSMIWKGIALWYAARDGNKGWFIALMLINTVGILEIVYIFAVRTKVPAFVTPASHAAPKELKTPEA